MKTTIIAKTIMMLMIPDVNEELVPIFIVVQAVILVL